MSNPISLLLVDDDQIVLDTIGYGLRQASYAVRECTSARDAMRAYVRDPPDLAVLDIGLPDMRGTALAEQLLEHRYRPILILSNHSEPEWVKRAIGSGAIGYLVKPQTPVQLIPSIETSLARFGEINRSIVRNFGDEKMSETQVQAVLDQLSVGIVIIDKDCQIVVCNLVARKFLSNSKLLRNANGILRTSARNEPLSAVLDQSLGVTGGNPTPAAYTTHDDDVTIQILGIPLHPAGPSREPAATMLIHDSSLGAAVPLHLYKSLYGLTEKESNLAHALVNGSTINDYCKTVFVSPNTARTHLKSIYRKTSTNRQAELISLLSRLYINLSDNHEEARNS